MKTTVVVGLGCSGASAARLLNKEGHNVVVLEQSQTPQILKTSKALIEEGIEVKLGTPLATTNFEFLKEELDCVVVSPGVPWNHPTLEALRQQGININGEMAIAWERLKKYPWIGITGTNGKTTVTHLLSHVLESNGKKAPMGGNVGFAATQLALELQEKKINSPDWLLMELSSYQIEAAPNIKPRIGIWTNLTPDHLERHGNLEAYRTIKRGLLERSEVRIFNGDDPDLKAHRKTLKEGTWISAEGPGSSEESCQLWINDRGAVEGPRGPLFNASALNLPGKHNLQNLLLVTAAALNAGIPPQGIEKSIHSFQGLPHRLEKIGQLSEMEIFNDSKATNYQAASMGLKAVGTPLVLIAGGKIKEGDPSEWLKEVKFRACSVVLFGTSALELKELLESEGFKRTIHCCKDLQNAVNLGIKVGINEKAASLLLSPACASFDQYANFEARGNHFRQLIEPFLATAKSNK